MAALYALSTLGAMLKYKPHRVFGRRSVRGLPTSKRRGFYAIYTMIWMLLATLFAGFALLRADRAVKEVVVSADEVIQDELAQISVDAAEDWLVSMFELGDIPRSRGLRHGMRHAEALRMTDGTGFVLPDEISSLGVEVLIADTSFDIAASTASDWERKYPIPSIPHEIRDMGSGRVSRYFYYIIGRALTGALQYRSVRAELIRVDIDATFGGIADVRRISSQRWSEAP